MKKFGIHIKGLGGLLPGGKSSGFPLREPRIILDASSYFEYPTAADCEALTCYVVSRFKGVRAEEVLFNTGADATPGR